MALTNSSNVLVMVLALQRMAQLFEDQPIARSSSFMF